MNSMYLMWSVTTVYTFAITYYAYLSLTTCIVLVDLIGWLCRVLTYHLSSTHQGLMLEPPTPGPYAGVPMGGIGSGCIGRGIV